MFNVLSRLRRSLAAFANRRSLHGRSGLDATGVLMPGASVVDDVLAATAPQHRVESLERRVLLSMPASTLSAEPLGPYPANAGTVVNVSAQAPAVAKQQYYNAGDYYDPSNRQPMMRSTQMMVLKVKANYSKAKLVHC